MYLKKLFVWVKKTTNNRELVRFDTTTAAQSDDFDLIPFSPRWFIPVNENGDPFWNPNDYTKREGWNLDFPPYFEDENK